ncbi:ATPase [Streptomyces longisporoflavus]|uniref:ATP-binding protein n=1 Tax=Streptomyces longisporoflavus TaxID=28044 RepID=UPI00167C983A|nr:ATP-binding protein [Streptomyces longisporoflavus]GGV53259.1 ATPase [Streptomyces longisporoflavus]
MPRTSDGDCPDKPNGTDDQGEPWEYTLYIPHDLRAVTIGRRTLRLVLNAHGLPHLAEAAELLATELVSNALRHTKGPAALRLRWAGRVLRIGVWDADPTPPEPASRVAAYAEEGRGLGLIRSCSDGWGWYPLGGSDGSGKYVWCELTATATALAR